MATNDSTTDTNDDSAPDQLQIDQAIVMLNDICQRVFNARALSARLRGDEESGSLIALADSLSDSLNVVGLLADSAAQKIEGHPGDYVRDLIEWVVPPLYATQSANSQIEGA